MISVFYIGMRDFHHTKGWRRIRETALRKAGYQCVMSKRYGKNVPAQMVHHALPIDDYPQYAMALWNLVPMTNEWHGKMHDRNTNKLTAEGQRLAMRIAQQNGVEYGNEEDRDKGSTEEDCSKEA